MEEILINEIVEEICADDIFIKLKLNYIQYRDTLCSIYLENTEFYLDMLIDEVQSLIDLYDLDLEILDDKEITNKIVEIIIGKKLKER